MWLALALWAAPADAGELGLLCRRQAGLDVGLVYAPNTWDRIGLNPWFVGGGLTAGFACSADVGKFMVWGALEYTILYPHYASATDLRHDWLQAFIGASGRAGPVWVGAHIAGDFLPVGAGAHLLWLPGDEQARQRQGLELRLNGYWRIQPNIQLQLLYTTATPTIR
jgi:hypothetical protein